MQRWHKFTLAGVTAALALATGHVMQITTPADHPAFNRAQSAAITRNDAREAETVPAPDFGDLSDIETIAPLATDGAPPVPPRSALERPETPAVPKGLQPFRLSALSDAAVIAASSDSPGMQGRSAQGDEGTSEDCTPTLIAAPRPAAMVRLTLAAPCDPQTRVVIRHAGLAFGGMTTEDGTLSVSLPALTEDAQFTAALAQRGATTASLQVPQATDYARLGLQWQGADSFDLHAYEYGAEFGDAGHVWADNPRDPTFAARRGNGFMVTLGDDRLDWPLMAAIYSFPIATAPQAGDVRLDIEAPVTDRTCGREMLAETIAAPGDGTVEVVDLTVPVPVPDCNATGGFIVLKNLLPELKVAGN